MSSSAILALHIMDIQIFSEWKWYLYVFMFSKEKSIIMGYTQCCPNVLESFFGDTKLSIFEIFKLTFGWSPGKDFRTFKCDYSRAEVSKLCCTDQIWPATCYHK